jgi:Na+-translocating ferredoxin:NAD+ oxidoreductase RnfG subunit
MRVNRLKKFYVIAFLIVIIIIAIPLIIFMTNITSFKLEFQQEQQTLETLQQIFPEASFYIYDEEIEVYTVYDTVKKQIGYAFYAEGMGEFIYEPEGGTKVPGPIVVLVGLEDSTTIKGIFVVSHSETPYIFDRLFKKNYFDQFLGLKIEDAYFRRDDGQINAVTGATSSSRVVLNTVREAALEKFIPGESKKIEWQIILTLAIVIPFVLIPVVFTWYTTIKQALAK